jgi:hypothetical protein
VFTRSGISPCGTYLPAWINPVHTKEPKYDMDTAKKEAEMTMCGALLELLEKTGVDSQLGAVDCAADIASLQQRWQRNSSSSSNGQQH